MDTPAAMAGSDPRRLQLALAPEKRQVLGIGVSVTDYASAIAAILAAAQDQRSFKVTALAVHGVMTGALDTVHRFRLNSFDLVCPDGQPVRWALNLLHSARLSDRVYGPDLTLKLCAAAEAEGLPVYFYGSRPEVLTALQAELGERFPRLKVAGLRPSLFRRATADEQAEINREIVASGARIVFVGLGCPRQEVWTFENADALGLPTIAVGAAFDFIAGNLPQAAPLLQRYGLEWAFRLWQEPKRLWRRYVLLNPAYLAMVFAQLTGLNRFEDRGAAPQSPELYG